MPMLAKAEEAYLGILRVVILAVATLAMIVAFGGLVLGGWFVAANSGSHPHAPPVEQVTLGDYITEQKSALAPQGGAVADTGSADQQAQIVVVREAIRPAYNDFIRYITQRMQDSSNRSGFAGNLNSDYDAIDDPYRASYATSLNSLAHQLVISKGKPLSIDQLANLITWHQKKFSDAIVLDKEAKAGAKVLGGQVVMVGAVSFLAFLLLVFCFIFVKMERNLRVMKTLTKVVEA